MKNYQKISRVLLTSVLFVTAILVFLSACTGSGLVYASRSEVDRDNCHGDFSVSHKEVCQDDYNNDYDNGYNNGYDNGYNNNYDNGYDNGYNNNYNNGWRPDSDCQKPTPTVLPTATVEPTVTPTPEVTATPTPEVTATPTPEVTATPTVNPTIMPTVIPTTGVTLVPTVMPTGNVLGVQDSKDGQGVLADTGLGLYTALGIGVTLLGSMIIVNKGFDYTKKK